MGVNAYLIAALVALSGAVGAYFYGIHVGTNEEKVHRQDIEDVKREVIAASADAAASAIAKIEVKNTTIRQTLEKEVRENTVYRDCRSGMSAVQLLNATPGIAASGVTASRSELP